MNEIVSASLDTLKKSLGIFGGSTSDNLQAVAIGTEEAVSKGIDKLESAGKYFLFGGLIVVGLVVYSKLK